MKNKKNILYLSYDGLADQLSNSQILPYIKILDNFFNVHVLTCEKKENKIKLKKIKNDLEDVKINYNYLFFSKKIYFISIFRIFDSIKIFFNLISLILKKNISIIHARGHIPAFTSYFVSLFFNIKFIFDFRGLWVEERLDNNSLSRNNLFGYIIFKILKYIESKTLCKAYKIIVLTNSLKKKLIKDFNLSDSKFQVMPCYVDVNYFNKQANHSNLDIHSKLKINKNSKIICYLGSLGGFYLIDEMISFYSKLKLQHKEYIFLIITKQVNEIKSIINKIDNTDIKKSIKILNLDYHEVPQYLAKVDVSLFFLKNSEARLGTCPIKFAESLALGIPVICNSNIGDLDSYFTEANIGSCININKNDSVENLINNFDVIINLSKNNIKKYTNKRFSINNAFNKYNLLYIKLL